MRRTRVIAIIVIVVVLGGIGFVFANSLASSSTTEGGNLLTNGGFETGDLRGWQSGYLLTPSVLSTIVKNGTYAARFQTTSNGDALSQCTLHALECELLNSSTISQDVSGVPISPDTRFSFALYPSFQYPSTFQITLVFQPSQKNSSDITIYYIFHASSEQCDTYSQLLVNASQNARAFCLPAQQGEWNVIARSISDDIPPALSLSALSGSSLTISLSFAGGNSSDLAHVDSVSLR
jgi:hypothetical protein